MNGFGNLNLNLLRVFVAVYETGNVTRAADRLGMSQSAVSGSISRLSKQLAEPLFERRAGGVQPTGAARQLYVPISDALHAFSSGLANAPDQQGGNARRHFRIALQNLAETAICGPALDELRRQRPNTTIEIVPPSATQIVPELLGGTLDIAFHVSPTAPPPHPDIVQHEAGLSHWVCITRKGWSDDHGPLTVATMNKAGVIALEIGRRDNVPVVHREDRGLSAPVLTVDRGWAIPGIVATSDHVATIPITVAASFADRFGLELHRIPFDYSPLPFFLMWHKRSEADQDHVQLRRILLQSGRPLADAIHTKWKHLIM